jgi:shikimate dehydrogenase
MKQYGLIGKSITHSYSKKFFGTKFSEEAIDAAYELFHLETIEEFPELLLKHPELAGLNVTIPYKQEVMRYLNELDQSAKMVGAVNTIKIDQQKAGTRLKGYNTDVVGFDGLLSSVIDLTGKNRALILGTGGASRAVQYVLRKNGIGFLLVSRGSAKHGQVNYHVLTKSVFFRYNIIINTTPLGMSPNVDAKPPIPYAYINKRHVLIDLIYNPEETQFLEIGKQAGATTVNGMQMFEMQAEASWNIWNTKK